MAKDKLQLEPATELPFVSTDSTQSKLTFEAFLAAMVKQAYLEKVTHGSQRKKLAMS